MEYAQRNIYRDINKSVSRVISGFVFLVIPALIV